MSSSKGYGSRIDGPSVSVPTMSVAEGGDDGIVLGLGLKQLGVVGAVGAVGLMVVVGAVAAGTFLLLSDGNDADVDLVPQGASSITYVNVDQATSDQAIGEVVDTWYELEPSDVDSMDEALAEFENETGLDPDDLHHATVFSAYDESTGTGAGESSATILRTDWAEDDFVATVEDDNAVSVSETTYNGLTVYEPDEEPAYGTSSSWIAVLEDGTYVVGTESAVKDTVDVHQGDADPIEGELRTAFENTRDGYVQFAFQLPEERVPSQGGQIDTSKLRDVELVTGAYYTTSNSLGAVVTMHASSESAARDVADVVDGGFSVVRGTTQDEALKDALRDVEVTQDGSEVTVTYENAVEDINELLRALDEQSGDDEVEENVQAGVSVSDEGDGEVKVTWTSNQNADHLQIQVESDQGPDDFARLSNVGDSYTYEGEPGTEVTVVVTGVAGDTSTVILEQTFSL